MSKTGLNQKVIGLAISVLLILVAAFVAPPSGLSLAGMRSMLAMIIVLVWMVTETFPVGMSCVLGCIIAVYLNVFDGWGSVWGNFGVSTMIYLIGTFAITAVMVSTTLPLRLARTFVKWSRGNSRLLVLFFALGAGILSSLMSNLATCGTFVGVAVSLMKANGDPKPATSNLGKCLMIGVVAGSGIGGFATPIGCATNLLGLEMVTSLTGKTVSFMEYTAVGYPIMLVTLTVLWLILTTIFKVEPLDEKAIGAAETLPPMTAKEKKGVLIIIAMIVCWFLGSWVTVLNGTAVAALGAILLLMPGIEVIDWKGLNSVISWDILLCCGAIQPLVIAIANADGPTWLVNNFLSVVDGMPMILLTFIMCLIAVGLHVIIPSGGPIITLLGVPYISMFVALGYNPVIAIMLTTFGCGMALILPYDGLVLMAKPYGYFTVGEYVKQGIVNSAVLCVVMTVMVVILGGIFLPAF